MFGSQLLLVDPQLQPRRGQKISLGHFEQEITGRINRASATALEIRPDHPGQFGRFPPTAHLRAVIITRTGPVEIVLTGLSRRGEELIGQIVGHPVSINRRTDRRVDVPLDATLVWLDPQSAKPLQRQGHTDNLSVGGALLRFPKPRHPLPRQDTTALLALRLPSGNDPLMLSARVLHAWEDGARVHVVDAAPPIAERLQAFVDSRPA